MNLFKIVIATLIISGCSKKLEFEVEPEYRRTIGTVADLTEGDVIRVAIQNISTEETFRFQLCGPQCNTASNVAEINLKDLNDAGEATLSAPENGKYYFWLQNNMSNKAIEVASEAKVNKGRLYQFETGTTVTIIQ